jgi:phage terminase large subunit-like protein
VRAVDKAGTEGGDGAYTACVLMHQMKDGRFVIENVTRGRWGALEREQTIKQLAQLDSQTLRQHGKWAYTVVIEQEPGSGGKESAEATIRNLAGFTAVADKVTGAKEVRAEPFAAPGAGGQRVADRRPLGAGFPRRSGGVAAGTDPRPDRRRRHGVRPSHRRLGL